jgi:hypothetical protein
MSVSSVASKSYGPKWSMSPPSEFQRELGKYDVFLKSHKSYLFAVHVPGECPVQAVVCRHSISHKKQCRTFKPS